MSHGLTHSRSCRAGFDLDADCTCALAERTEIERLKADNAALRWDCAQLSELNQERLKLKRENARMKGWIGEAMTNLQAQKAEIERLRALQRQRDARLAELVAELSARRTTQQLCEN